MKKVISLILSVMLIVPMFSITAYANTDISGHWAQATIESWVNRGYISGYPDGTFRPDAQITRAELSSIINKAFGFSAASEFQYSDVRPGDWYYSAMNTASALGYMSGYGDGTLKPNNPVTRAETAVIITRISNLNPNEAGASGFSDVERGHWSAPYIGAVTSAGIMAGFSDGTFKPNQYLSRAEAVASLDYALSRRSGASSLASATYLPPFELQQDSNMGNYYNLANRGNASSSNNNYANTNSSSTTSSVDSVVVSTSSYGSSGDDRNVNGNMEITATSTTIRNVDISGDLIISSRTTGTVNLQNVNVRGKIIIYGRANVILNDSYASELYVDAGSGSNVAKVTLKGESSIDVTQLYSEATLTATSIRRGYDGYGDVYVSSSVKSGARITLAGQFDSVEIDADRVRLNLTSGSIKDLTVNDNATNCTISLSSGTEVDNMDIDGRYTKVTGSGKIDTAYVNAKNVSFSRKPNTVRGSETPSYTNDYDDDDDGIYTAEIFVSDQNNRELNGASVVLTRISNSRNYSKTTNSYGEVVFYDLPAGNYELHISKSGYGSFTTTITINRDDFSGSYRIAPGYSYEFSVKDESGNAVTNANVRLGSSISQGTNSNGTAVFNDLNTQSYNYTVSASGYESASGSISVSSSGNNRTEVVLKVDTVNPTPSPSPSPSESPAPGEYSVKITVKNTKGQSVSGAAVAVKNNSTTLNGSTDASGVVSFNLAKGNYTLDVEKEHYTSVKGESLMVEQDLEYEVTLSDANSSQNSVMNFKITDNDGTAIPGASIIISKDGKSVSSTQADSNGERTVSTVSPGTYSVKVVATYYQAAAFDITIEGGQNYQGGQFDVKLTNELYTLSVAARDATSQGMLSSSTQIEFKLWQSGVLIDTKTCNGNGSVKFEDLKMGYYDITASAANYDDGKIENRLVTVSNTADVYVLLKRQEGSVSLTVVDAEDNTKKINNATVIIDGKDRGKTNGSGELLVPIAVGEDYGITVTASYYDRNDSETVTVTTGSPVDKTIGLTKSRYELTVAVVNSSDRPITTGSMTAKLIGDLNGTKTAPVGADGKAVFTNIVAENAVLELDIPPGTGYVVPAPKNIVIGGNATETFKLVKGMGTATITVTDTSSPANSIYDAFVSLTNEYGTQAAYGRTDNTGTKSFTVEAGTYTVHSTHSAYGEVKDPVTVTVTDGGNASANLQLKPISYSMVLSVKNQEAMAVPGARFTLTEVGNSSNKLEGSVSEGGVYTITDISAGYYKLEVKEPPLAGKYEDYVNESILINKDFSYEVIMEDVKATVKFIFTENEAALTGAPLTATDIFINNQKMTVPASGELSLKLSKGNYAVKAVRNNIVLFEQTYTVPDSTNQNFDVALKTRKVTFKFMNPQGSAALSPTLDIFLQVKDTAKNAVIHEYKSTTGNGGAYDITLPFGNYTVDSYIVSNSTRKATAALVIGDTTPVAGITTQLNYSAAETP